MTYFVIRTNGPYFSDVTCPRVELTAADYAEADAEAARLEDELSPDYRFIIAEAGGLEGRKLTFHTNTQSNVIGVEDGQTRERIGVLRRAEEDTYWMLDTTAVAA